MWYNKPMEGMSRNEKFDEWTVIKLMDMLKDDLLDFKRKRESLNSFILNRGYYARPEDVKKLTDDIIGNITFKVFKEELEKIARPN
jgi:hypothetical protein